MASTPIGQPVSRAYAIGTTQRGKPLSSEPIQVALRLYDAFTTVDPSIVDDVVAVGFMDHNLAPGQSPGPEGLRQRVSSLTTTFPDVQITHDVVLSEGDRVVVRSTVHGTHLGAFNDIPPTGRTVAFDGIDIWRVEGGKIVEAWHLEETLGLLMQLGVGPGGDASATPAGDVSPLLQTTPSGADVNAEISRDLTRRWIEEVFNAHDPSALDELVSEEFLDHDPLPGTPRGREGFKPDLVAFFGAFPDLHSSIENLIVDGNLTAVRQTVRGTHRGAFAGVPSTGTSVEFGAIDILRIEGETITDIWHIEDNLALLTQLGVIPAAMTGGQVGTPGR